ncbi:Hypothetical protein ETEE_p1058 (plasmid) [Edwardsiella anguillarum ET080813]|uniref:PD-(D/E)XK endonuclease-like domain-containing protein n=1 Tax=Edwardsiella anguillarum ET080813 TaxID=667120 RepID=A0A076LZ66_9GAMM|nr:Hypothetical protein ETEE_p1058 [Edwardsiella anguillarum ET080813]
MFKTKRGILIILDTKSRGAHRIYSSDIIQLSAYQLILKHQYSYPVAKYGYVRTVVEDAYGEKVRYLKVKLLSDREVIKLWQRYQDIHSGTVHPSCYCGGRFHMNSKPSS